MLVTSVAAGVVRGVTIIGGGAYTANPLNPVSVTDTSTPAAAGATFNLSFAVTKVELVQPGSYSATPANPVSVTDTNSKVVTGPLAAAAIKTGGTKYKIGDLLTVLGGSFGVPATMQVTTVSGTGAVTGVLVISGGSYTANPVNPVSVLDNTTATASGYATF